MLFEVGVAFGAGLGRLEAAGVSDGGDDGRDAFEEGQSGAVGDELTFKGRKVVVTTSGGGRVSILLRV